MSPPICIRDARVLTLARGERPRRGAELADLSVLARGDVLVDDGCITAVLPHEPDRGADDLLPGGAKVEVIDARGRVLIPGFVDCHTHACFTGSRLDEWDMKRAGASYLDILRKGGGINATVRSVRAASRQELARQLRRRLAAFLAHGTTTVEVKSGYGLTPKDETRMLEAIAGAAFDSLPQEVVPTALLGHAIDPEQPGFVGRTIGETLDAVHALAASEGPEAVARVAVDAYVEQGAWSVADAVALLQRAAALGHPVRVHADQFTSMGMIGEAVRLGARSVDHLEASTDADLDLLAASPTAGVILPACGFHLDGRYARARRLVDAGGFLALATNFNPGSAPTFSMPMAIALAVRHCGLSAAEAISACTVNAAEVLGLSDRGAIEPGARADLILLRHLDERDLAFEFGANCVDAVIVAGELLIGRAPPDVFVP